MADEINRAELSRVFGELLYTLEYRGEKGKIKTQYASMRNDEDFYVPENVFFLGTMNDLDKSIDSFDLALRRRFI
ncbi:AAA domain-containing protein [Campylobacter coli]|nr:AAA domain-containing protein [Campylobacter coli]